MEQAVFTGLAFGGIYAWRRQIWFVMILHAASSTENWEATVAHLLFR